MAGIYVHFPFCASFCIYCDFYSEKVKGGSEAYIEALLREIQARKGFFDACCPGGAAESPSTLYFGGGTPSVVPPDALSRVADALRGAFGVQTFAEFTIEANPDDVCASAPEQWRAMGVNRLSLGVQSLNDSHLKWMRRRHDAAGAVRAFEAARKAGFDNISIDLIFGYEALSMSEWRETLHRALVLGAEHISCYQMSIEKGSALGRLAERGLYREPSQEECASQYALMQEMLAAEGYLQYEISNFAKPGRESRHNSSYWERSPYLGLGAAAHSFDGISTRSWNAPDMARYSACVTPSDFNAVAESESLSAEISANETVMLALRRSRGLDTSLLGEPYRSSVLERSRKLVAEALLEREGSVLRIPASKFFVSDDIISDLFL